MITREEAVEAAIDYLTGGLRKQLEAREGWPGEVERQELEAPAEESALGIVGFPKRVWSVSLPNDEPHVGSSLYLIIDAETGCVFTRMPWGE